MFCFGHVAIKYFQEDAIGEHANRRVAYIAIVRVSGVVEYCCSIDVLVGRHRLVDTLPAL